MKAAPSRERSAVAPGARRDREPRKERGRPRHELRSTHPIRRRRLHRASAAGCPVLPRARRRRGPGARALESDRQQAGRRRPRSAPPRPARRRRAGAASESSVRRGLRRLDVRRQPGDLDRRAGARSHAGARAAVRAPAGRMRDRGQGGAAQEGARAAVGLREGGERRLDRVLLRRAEGARTADRRRSPQRRARDRARTPAPRWSTSLAPTGRRAAPKSPSSFCSRGANRGSSSTTCGRSSPTPPRRRSTTSSIRRSPAICQGAVDSAVRYFGDGGDADQLVMRLVARLTLLHRVRLEMEAGHPFDAACQTLYVRLPPEARRALAKAAERWTSETIAQRLPSVRAMSAKVRRYAGVG